MHGGGDAINKILELWVEGFTFSQISVEVGLSKKEVSQHVYILRVNGSVNLRPKRKVTIMDLRYNSCRYVTGNDEELGTLYCGDAIAKRSYCMHHFTLCYMPPSK